MNTPEALAWAHRPYIELVLPISDGEEPVGADYLADWYRRNILIFQKLLAQVRTDTDRIFTVYGQGHAKLIQDLVADHPRLCVEDPLPYLDAGR